MGAFSGVFRCAAEAIENARTAWAAGANVSINFVGLPFVLIFVKMCPDADAERQGFHAKVAKKY